MLTCIPTPARSYEHTHTHTHTNTHSHQIECYGHTVQVISRKIARRTAEAVRNLDTTPTSKSRGHAAAKSSGAKPVSLSPASEAYARYVTQQRRSESTPNTQVDTPTAEESTPFQHFLQKHELRTPPVRAHVPVNVLNKHLYRSSPGFARRDSTPSTPSSVPSLQPDLSLNAPCFDVSNNSMETLSRAPEAILNVDRLVTSLTHMHSPAKKVLIIKKIMRLMHNLKDSLDLLLS